eukprot:768788-Hanusia_phi.AAC.1
MQSHIPEILIILIKQVEQSVCSNAAPTSSWYHRVGEHHSLRYHSNRLAITSKNHGITRMEYYYPLNEENFASIHGPCSSFHEHNATAVGIKDHTSLIPINNH